MQEQNNDYVNQTTGYSVPGESAPAVIPASAADALTPAPVSWRECVMLLPALVLSILFWAVFGFDAMNGYLPGLGIPVFTAVFFAVVLLVLRGRISPAGIFPMAAALALAVSCALYAYDGYALLNCFAILMLSAMATFALSGQGRFSVLDIRAIPEAIRLSVAALFTRIDRPFRSAAQLSKRGKASLPLILGTTVVTLVLLGVVLALLSSADMVFGSFFTGIREWFEAISFGTLLWRVIRVVVLTLIVASGLCFLLEKLPAEPERAAAKRELKTPVFLVPTIALDVVYLIFCAIQLRFLFGGAEAAAMAGGWAAYARTGFFQLVTVAVINLVVCLAGTNEERFAAKGGAVLRAAEGVMLLLTLVILVSAYYRMHLYIAAFGLSILRLTTLWGMFVILVGLLAAGFKLLRPAFAFWRVFFIAAVASWCLLSLAGPAARVADYNVDAYLSGRLKTADVDYLRSLGPDARPALERLADGSDKYDKAIRSAMTGFDRDAHDTAGRWSLWNLARSKGGAVISVTEPTPSSVSAAVPTDEPTGEPTNEPAAAVDRGTAPILSPAAATDSALSSSFLAKDGVILTTDIAGDGFVPIAALCSGLDGYVSSFLLDGGWLYVAEKDSFYSLDPARLWRFPAAGSEGELLDGELLTDDLSAASRFCIAGGVLFYQSFEDEGLWRLDPETGLAARVIEEPSSLLAASDGFIYYASGGGVYRNDSTMTAEVYMFGANVLRLEANLSGLCDLTCSPDGSVAILELRDLDGALKAEVDLPEFSDNFLLVDRLVYVPQEASGDLIVYDMFGVMLDRDGAPLPTYVLSPLGVTCTLCCADGDALYYETYLDGDRCIVRLPLDGSTARIAARQS